MLRAFSTLSIIVFLCLNVRPLNAQTINAEVPSINFFALIVADLDSSIEWYANIASFEVLNRNVVDEMGLRQANLSNGIARLELIELTSSKSISDLVSDYDPRIRVEGLFKIGFTISDFDLWLSSISNLVEINQSEIVIDPVSKNRMIILRDPDGNRIQFFEQ